MQQNNSRSQSVQFSVVYGYMICAVALFTTIAMSIPHISVGP